MPCFEIVYRMRLRRSKYRFAHRWRSISGNRSGHSGISIETISISRFPVKFRLKHRRLNMWCHTRNGKMRFSSKHSDRRNYSSVISKKLIRSFQTFQYGWYLRFVLSERCRTCIPTCAIRNRELSQRIMGYIILFSPHGYILLHTFVMCVHIMRDFGISGYQLLRNFRLGKTG